MTPKDHLCPKCGGSHFTRWALPHPLILFWVINPLLAFNEIVLGQRIAKVTLVCRDCEGPSGERAYIPCPHCQRMHLGALNRGWRAFGNWRGFACPNCAGAIPCLWNLCSLVILILTFPLWALPYYLYFKHRPGRRLALPGEVPHPPRITARTWVLGIAFWAILQWTMMTLVPFLQSDRLAADRRALWSNAIGFSTMAVVTGAVAWFVLRRQKADS